MFKTILCLSLAALIQFSNPVEAQTASYLIAGQQSGSSITYQTGNGDSLPMNFFPGPYLDLDLDGNGYPDFRLRNEGWGQGFGATYAKHYLDAFGDNKVLDVAGNSVSPLHFGDTIDGADTAQSASIGGLDNMYFPQSSGWPCNQDSLYVGVSVTDNWRTRLGWIQLKVTCTMQFDSTVQAWYISQAATHIKDWALGYTMVGLDENATHGFKLYPVPSTGRINLMVPPGARVESWRVSVLLGRVVSQHQGEDRMLDAAGLGPGTYLLDLKTHDGTVTLRFLVE